MDKGIRYSDEFKQEAVNQVVIHGYSVRLLCRALDVHLSGYYGWLRAPYSNRAIQDRQLTAQIKQFWLESGCHSDYHNIHLDLTEAKITCGRDRVLRLMEQAQIRAERGYKKPKGIYGGRPHLVVPNVLDREFDVDQPNQWG